MARASRIIAMWSGPRNISTALLRAFGNRPDTAVCDEPLYGHYLSATGLPHPGAREVIASMETDWRRVAARLTGPPPGGKSIYYQKHMAHHLLPEMEIEWIARLSNALLIRDPRAMLRSLSRVLPEPRLEDTGLPQQLRLFEWLGARSGRLPPVIDARDVLEAPAAMLRHLCAALDIEFTTAMLHWPAGRRPTDGVWACHWYASVEASTGFMPYRPATASLPERLEPLCAACQPFYEQLARHRLAA